VSYFHKLIKSLTVAILSTIHYVFAL